MQSLKERFPYLDERLWPHVQHVLDRLPETPRREILKDPSFQLVASEDFFTTCVVCLKFSQAVLHMASINPRILREPAHRIALAICAPLADFWAAKSASIAQGLDAAVILEQWGFKRELEAVHQDEVMSRSEGYQVGYRWAKQQNTDYLRQHFGIYADESSPHKWGDLPEDTPDATPGLTTTASIMEEITGLKPPDYPAISLRTQSTTPLARRMVLAGIIAALKEKESQEHPKSRPCELAAVA